MGATHLYTPEIILQMVERAMSPRHQEEDLKRVVVGQAEEGKGSGLAFLLFPTPPTDVFQLTSLEEHDEFKKYDKGLSRYILHARTIASRHGFDLVSAGYGARYQEGKGPFIDKIRRFGSHFPVATYAVGKLETEAVSDIVGFSEMTAIFVRRTKDQLTELSRQNNALYLKTFDIH